MSKKTPTHNVRLLPESDAQDQSWPFVGAAWQNRDGSFNIILNQELPKGARIQIRKRKAAAAKAAS